METVLLRPREAAELLGLSRSQVYSLCRRGELPTVRIGASVRVPRRALEEWVARRATGLVPFTD